MLSKSDFEWDNARDAPSFYDYGYFETWAFETSDGLFDHAYIFQAESACGMWTWTMDGDGGQCWSNEHYFTFEDALSDLNEAITEEA